MRESANLFLRVLNFMGWLWLTVCSFALIFFMTLQAFNLPDKVWMIFSISPRFRRGESFLFRQAVLVPTWVVIIAACLMVAIFVVVMVLNQKFGLGKPNGWTNVVIVLGWVTSVMLTTIIVGASFQVGLPLVDSGLAAYKLIGQASKDVGIIVGVLSLGSLLGVPFIAITRHEKRSTKNLKP